MTDATDRLKQRISDAMCVGVDEDLKSDLVKEMFRWVLSTGGADGYTTLNHIHGTVRAKINGRLVNALEQGWGLEIEAIVDEAVKEALQREMPNEIKKLKEAMAKGISMSLSRYY